MVYQKKVREIVDVDGQKISVFSAQDEYIEIYDKISADHLVEHRKSGKNPFIETSFWAECEATTVQLIKRHGKKGGKLLDVGCGLGNVLRQCQEFECYGLDISLGYLREAAKVTSAELCMSKVEDIPYYSDTFDVVVCTDVLEHVIDLHTALKQIFRVLKPGGTAIFRTPYRENLNLYTKYDFPYRYAHVRNFDEYGMKILCERVYQQKVEDFHFGPYMIDPGYLKVSIQGRGIGVLFRAVFFVIGLLPTNYRMSVIRTLLNPVEFHTVVKCV
ncbi:MAG: methyltransferase domain-containing protein [Alphaproteobacteria bacterium]|nr:methyltransferase domain-containing protein [Alphaproteobacteria bacterium]